MMYKPDMISGKNLFFMLFVSRVLIAFTVSAFILGGYYSMDLIFSTAIALVIVILLSIPAVIMTQKKRTILDNRAFAALYGVYYSVMGAVYVSKFAYFASTELNQSIGMVFLAAVIIFCAAYASYLGIEPISRFGAMVFFITILGAVGIIGFSFKNFSVLNFFPIFRNNTKGFMDNIIYSVTSTSELVLLISLSPYVNGKTKKPYFTFLLLSFACGVAFVVCAIGALGDKATYSVYPIFEVSQISTLASNERLDSVFTGFWIFAVFLKTSLFLFSASSCFERAFKFKSGVSGSALSGVLMLGVAAVFLSNTIFAKSSNLGASVPFALFAFAIPLGYLIFSKNRRGDMLENF